MTRIAQTGFIVSLISYGVFALADYARPGFVSYVFSLHWFLLAIIVFGVWLAYLHEEAEVSKWITWPIQIIVAIVVFVVLWDVGEQFGDFRGLLALASAAMVWLLPRLLRGQRE